MTDVRTTRFSPNEPRILIHPEELEKAILIWLGVMPKRIWREVEAWELKKATKRFSREDDPGVYRHVAAYLAGKVAQAQWDVVRRVRPVTVDNRPEPGDGSVIEPTL
jgi:hypothetical protein